MECVKATVVAAKDRETKTKEFAKEPCEYKELG